MNKVPQITAYKLTVLIHFIVHVNKKDSPAMEHICLLAWTVACPI